MLRAVLSIGTNTVRLLVVRDDAAGLTQLEHLQTGTRLGEGLRDGGTLAPEAVRRTLEAVRAFAGTARARGAALQAIATSAVRRADDGPAFAAAVAAIAGVPLEVLAGRAEAEASFRGATHAGTRPGVRVAVVDVGGGSTECAIGRDGALEAARSIETGSVRVVEAYPALAGGAPGEPARAAARAARAGLAARLLPFAELGRPEEVRAVAGTPLTVAAIALASHVDRVSGTVLGLDALDGVVDRLLGLDLAARRALPGMLAQRADVLVGGALILSETLRVLGARAALVEADDLLLGHLLATRSDAAGE